MLNHVGTQRIETEKLILRRFEYSDAEAMLRYWAADERIQSLYSEPVYSTLNEVNGLLDKYIGAYEKDDYYRWAVIEKSSGKCIGQIAYFLVDSKNHFATASHVILDTEYRETSSLQDVLDGKKKHQCVVYAVTSYSEWVAEKEILSWQWTDGDPVKVTFVERVAEKEILSERWIEGGPAKMTFDVMSDGTFQLMGYWEPRGGEEYGNDLQYMFSSEAIEKLYDVELGKGMNYSLRRIQILYEQAVHGLGLDGEAIVAGMLDEIMATADEYLSAPSSEDPNWGQWLQHIDTLLYDMSYYGNYTLSYLYKEFLKGGQTDLRGEVMRIAMVRTDTYQRAIDYDPANGQEYFDAWLEHERRQMETMGADYMKQKCYSSWLALKLAGLIE